MRDRYSIVVGLLFLALIVVAVDQHAAAASGEGTLGLDEQPRALAAARVRRAGRRRASWKATPTSPRTTARPRAVPCPERRPAHPRLPDRDARRDPRLRPLRPAAGDLVLVHQRAATASTSRTWSTRVYRRYRGRVSFLSLDVRDDRDTVRDLIRRARLEDAGRLRPRRRRRQPLPGRRLPDLRLRLPRRHPAERQHRRPRPRRSSSARVERAAARRPRAAEAG